MTIEWCLQASIRYSHPLRHLFTPCIPRKNSSIPLVFVPLPVCFCFRPAVQCVASNDIVLHRDSRCCYNADPIQSEAAGNTRSALTFVPGRESVMLNRRNMLQGMAASVGTAFGASLLPERLLASPASGTTPKRIIFFMQNQGFDPATCIPKGMSSSGSLAKATLPEPIEALEPYKERLHIINGLHGIHTSPSHSAFFGALAFCARALFRPRARALFARARDHARVFFGKL